jgi:hypothetical protein
MNFVRNSSRRLGRAQPPLMRQFWLHRTVHQRRLERDGDAAGDQESSTTESTAPKPDDQT